MSQQPANSTPKHYRYRYDIATEYFPETTPENASRLFRRELKNNPKLWNELLLAGYKPGSKLISPKQIAIITRYLG